MTASTASATTTFHIEPAFEHLLHAHGLATLDDVFDDARLNALGAERLDKPGLSDWRSRLRLRLPTPGETEPTTFYVKRFDHPPALARREIKRSRSGARTLAGVEWAWMHRLEHDGIPCPEPVALVEQMCGGREARSALVTLEVPGQSLERWLTGWSVADIPTVRARLGPLAELIARLHAAGYVHRDLYLSHVFFNPQACHAAAGVSGLCLIDLQRVRRPTIGARRLIIKDLAALNYSASGPLISACDRVRWLKYYLGVDRLDARSRRLLYRVMGKTRLIARHDARRRARLATRSNEA